MKTLFITSAVLGSIASAWAVTPTEQQNLLTAANRGTSNSSFDTTVLRTAMGSDAQDLTWELTAALANENAVSYLHTTKTSTASEAVKSAAVSRASVGDFRYQLDMSYSLSEAQREAGYDRMLVSALSIDLDVLRERYTHVVFESNGVVGESIGLATDMYFRYSLIDTTRAVTLCTGASMITTGANGVSSPTDSIRDAVTESLYDSDGITLNSTMNASRAVVTLEKEAELHPECTYRLVLMLDAVTETGTQTDVPLNDTQSVQRIGRDATYTNFAAVGNIGLTGALVPEPATASLGLLALAALVSRRRRA